MFSREENSRILSCMVEKKAENLSSHICSGICCLNSLKGVDTAEKSPLAPLHTLHLYIFQFSHCLTPSMSISLTHCPPIYFSLVYPLCHFMLTHSLEVTNPSQNASFYHFHHSPVNFFFLARYAKLSIRLSSSILVTPQGPLRSLITTDWMLDLWLFFLHRYRSYLYMSVLELSRYPAVLFMSPCLLSFLSLHTQMILPLSFPAKVTLMSLSLCFMPEQD